MKTRTAVGTIMLALLCSSSALAHGGHTHIMGSVTDLSTEQITVKDRDGKSVTIRVTKDTTYQKGDAPAAAADLKVGDRVVVEATGKEGSSFTATEIRFSSSAPQSGHEDGDPHAEHR